MRFNLVSDPKGSSFLSESESKVVLVRQEVISKSRSIKVAHDFANLESSKGPKFNSQVMDSGHLNW